MKDYFGKKKGVVYLGVITGKEFEKVYQEMSNSPDKLPLASTIIPLTDSNGCTLFQDADSQEPVIQAWIFYETIPQDNRTADKETGIVKPTKKFPEIKV